MENKIGIAKTEITKVTGQLASQSSDYLVVEEPLEIRLGFSKNGARHQTPISVTMPTPGHDEELALGFLFTEGIIKSNEQISAFSRPTVRWKEARENVLLVELHDDVVVDLGRLERNFYTSSSCGVCGKASIEAVRVQGQWEHHEPLPLLQADVLHTLPSALAQEQSIFDCTGGLHGAALFDANGQLLLSREDVGRHNALDKLIGARIKGGFGPGFALVTCRASYEIVMKAAVAGIDVLAAVSAPTARAVRLAEDTQLTLAAFVRGPDLVIYSHAARIVDGQSE